MSWRMEPAATGVLVVDVQERLLPAIFKSSFVARQCARLVEAARFFAMPLWVTEQLPEKLGHTVTVVAEAVGDVVPLTKSSFSSSPVLCDPLPETMILCGIETHVCVRQTARDLLQRGVRPVLAADACGSRRPEDKSVALDEFRQLGFRVGTVESLVFEMLGDADHPRFREFLKIVK